MCKTFHPCHLLSICALNHGNFHHFDETSGYSEFYAFHIPSLWCKTESWYSNLCAALTSGTIRRVYNDLIASFIPFFLFPEQKVFLARQFYLLGTRCSFAYLWVVGFPDSHDIIQTSRWHCLAGNSGVPHPPNTMKPAFYDPSCSLCSWVSAHAALCDTVFLLLTVSIGDYISM